MDSLFYGLDLKTSLRALADLLMPRCCAVCGRELGLKEDHICLCCEMDIPYTYFWDMPRNAMADEFNSRIKTIDGVREPYCHAAALFFYDDASGYKRIPQRLKYDGGIAMGKEFSRRLGEVLASSVYFKDVDAIVPVPLHWARRWKRGYNQARVIADEVSRCIGAPVLAGVLSKPRRKSSQTRAGAAEREKNMSGAFKAEAPGIAARHILIVDDTFTTGSTLAACHAALRSVLPAGVRISVASLAYVQK